MHATKWQGGEICNLMKEKKKLNIFLSLVLYKSTLDYIIHCTLCAKYWNAFRKSA